MIEKRNSNLLWSYSTIGLQLAGIILIFFYIGYKLDKEFDRSPLFLIVFVFLGLVAAFYNFFKELQKIDAFIKKKNDEKNNTENKWLKK